MILAALLAASASADVALEPRSGQQFVTHRLRVEGLAAHPGHVLLALDPGETVSDLRAFTADEAQDLARGGKSRGGGLTAPTLRLMTADAYAAWRTVTDAEVERQRQACYQRNEGCPHASRFEPRIPPPQAVDCGFAVPLVTEGPASGPDTVVQVVQVVEASATTCVVRETSRTYERNGEAFTPPKGGCDVAGGLASAAAALLALGLFRRR